MLQLVKIKKNYLMKDQDPVRALRGVSLSFRRNEFVAILGPSGCGKTTLLNIIGGLDRYTEGDLIIKDKSTKNYTDRDWDTYRNHSIGFVFQSYNLIGHQTIQKNVELALTIAGVTRKERKERAFKALERVGLKGMEKKKPNQLSGGQMQRVAIARALVNNPEILLADEPTGALDSETSIQIMDLLKEVAEDRLVIMVTHNPDLANKYATRIVNMFDGVITGDTDPFDGKDAPLVGYRCPKCGTIITEKAKRCPNCKVKAIFPPEEEENKGSKKKSSMSFLTATALSIANLFSKSKRTILVAVAGSIGIFGVSTVLAASTGVRGYIDDMQDDMLSSYPLSIEEQTVDYTSLMSGLYADTDSKIKDFDINTRVGLNSMIDYLMDRYSDITSIKTNTINDDLVEFVNEIPEDYISAIAHIYAIDPTNNIFTSWAPYEGDDPIEISLNGLTQRYIAELKTVEGFSQYASYVDLFTDFMMLIPGEEDYILSQYDLLGSSKFPQNENEIMLVVENDSTLTDLVFAQMGYYHEGEVMNIAKKAIRKYDEEDDISDEELDRLYPYATSFSYEELLNKKLTYYPHDTIYHYDDIHLRDYVDYSMVLLTPTNDEFYVLQYNESSSEMLSKRFGTAVHFFSGVHLTTSPSSYEVFYAINIAPEMDTPEAGKPVYGTFLGASDRLAFTSLSGKFNQAEIARALESGDITLFNVSSTNDMAVVRKGENISLFNRMITETPAEESITGYQYPAVADPTWQNKTDLKITGILRPKNGVSFGCLRRGVYYTKEFQDKYMKDAYNSQIIRNEDHGFIAHLENELEKNNLYNAYVTFGYNDFSDPDHPLYRTDGYASSLNGDLSSSFSSLLSNITGVDNSAENNTHFRSLCGLKIVTETDEDGNVISQDYVRLPEKMNIYPVNFELKDKVNDYLDQWNKDVDITLYKGTAKEKVLHHEDRDELTYSDTISLIINVIDTMITIITTALVIFTSLSLVVSSFMIAVITYISVMERVKEIGVIRSLGGRKKDVSRLFIAENLVTGVLSGLIGLALTYLTCLIVNLVVAPFGIPAVAILTLPIAGIMLALSVFLSVMAGLIPSMHASRQDPVIALRSE